MSSFQILYQSPRFFKALCGPLIILDSSFNPPTLAHAALANYSPKSPILLLHSIVNSDKGISNDSTQRTDMMILLAKELEAGRDVGVGICREATFAAKSSVLQRELPVLMEEVEAVQLEFLLGWDTVIRFFDKKYYDKMDEVMTGFFEKDGSGLIFARRGDVAEEVVSEFLERPGVIEWKSKIKMIDLGFSEDISSSRVRKIIKESNNQLEGEEEIKLKLNKLVLPSIINYVIQQNLYID